MSLTVFCAQCGEECAHYNGNHMFPGEADSKNVFAICKVEGEMGALWDESKLTGTVFICRKCFSTLFPNAYKLYLERFALSKQRKFTTEEAEKLINTLFPPIVASSKKEPVARKQSKCSVCRHRRGNGNRRKQTN